MTRFCGEESSGCDVAAAGRGLERALSWLSDPSRAASSLYSATDTGAATLDQKSSSLKCPRATARCALIPRPLTPVSSISDQTRSEMTENHFRSFSDARQIQAVALRTAGFLSRRPSRKSARTASRTRASSSASSSVSSAEKTPAGIAVAVYTGLRQGEFLGLRWPDLDLDVVPCVRGKPWRRSTAPGSSWNRRT